MNKEQAISFYLFFTGLIFVIFSFKKMENKSVFLSSFGNNAFFVANELARSNNHKMVFLNTSSCKIDFHQLPVRSAKVYLFETRNIADHLLSLYHLATAKYIYIDNYVGILAALPFKKEVKIIQLWHAAGAIKRFGWSEPDTGKRSLKAQRRFQRVYNQFHYIPVGCFQMAHIFSEAFHLEPNRFLYTGVPQTDFYFDKEALADSVKKVKEAFPEIAEKKVVLYAPTFRKNRAPIPDFRGIAEELGDRFHLLLRLHPSVQLGTDLWTHPRMTDASRYPSVNELMAAADVLITDYSSLAVEFALLRKKMIFFVYDLDSYIKEQGLWAEEDLHFPGPIVKSTSELHQHIVDFHIDTHKIDRFNDQWNTFSNGHASRNLIKKVYEPDDLL